jgi:hypothetical protein
MNTKLYFLLLTFFLIYPINSYGDDSDINDYSASQSVWGGVGLIMTPSARFQEDGEFTFGINSQDPWSRLYSSIQLFPWLEATLRYTEGTNRAYNSGSSQTWKDKGIDFKFKLRDEDNKFPAIAIGLNDFGGSGGFSSEFIVASKRAGNFDFSLGLGWGKLGGGYVCPGWAYVTDTTHCLSNLKVNNPFSHIFDDFEYRGEGIAGGGKINLGTFFTGPTSFFGGIEYHTPIKNLSLQLEYDPTDYTYDLGKFMVFNSDAEIFELDSRMNITLAYKNNIGTDQINLNLGMVRGNTIYASLAMHTNLNQSRKPKFKAPKETLNRPYLDPYQELDEDWQKYLTGLIMWQMGNEGLVTSRIIFNNKELQVDIIQGRFLDPINAMELAARILGNNSPKNIDTITVVNLDQGMETLRISIPRNELVASVALGPLDRELLEFNNPSLLNQNAAVIKNEYLYPNFYWNIKPVMGGTVQHQQKFYFYQLQAVLHGEYQIAEGLALFGDYGINVTNNFDGYTYHTPDGDLPNVRQDRRLYLKEGESGLRKLTANYFFDVSNNVKGRITAGYLEWMYGGVSGELLYMPDTKHWGVSVDASFVKQRNYKQDFGFRDYKTVTAFLNLYYDIPFYNLNIKSSIGKFLGTDKGFDLDISRRFDNGSVVGARVGLTDCDAQCVGEGSFNKWIYFTLPLDEFYQKKTTNGHAGYQWAPLTKNAAQKVVTPNLYRINKESQAEVDILRKKNWSFKKLLSGFSATKKERI